MIRKKILTPFQKFISLQGSSGILLLITTIIAMIWANSTFSDSYHSLWQFDLGFTSDIFEIKKPLILWINDGLMAIFFFLIGLEIKREFLIGELNSTKKVMFPLVGAVGGMAVPILFYLLLNQNPETVKGWGISMATDIAFSLAVLNVLGKRVPISLKLFLTAFAIVDDLGAVLVIAIFYSSSLNFTLLSIAISILILIYFLSRKGIYSESLSIVSGGIIWILFLEAGLHPTLSGVLIAFAVPVRQKISTEKFTDELEKTVSKIKKSSVLNKPVLSSEQLELIDDLDDWSDKFRSPLQHLEHKLHNWVAYLIIPIFALANAGVTIDGEGGYETALIVTIIISLVFGKSIGISSFIFLSRKLKIIEVPKDINNIQIIGVSIVAGIGFTMAIFIAGLAFMNSPEYIDSAKIGILIGSGFSAIIGYCLLRFGAKKKE